MNLSLDWCRILREHGWEAAHWLDIESRTAPKCVRLTPLPRQFSNSFDVSGVDEAQGFPRLWRFASRPLVGHVMPGKRRVLE